MVGVLVFRVLVVKVLVVGVLVVGILVVVVKGILELVPVKRVVVR